MEIKVNKLPKSQAEIEVTVSPEEARPHLESAASKLSKQKPIDGYRPGHAPYDAVVRAYGEMAIYEAALQTIVVKAYAKAISDHQLQAYGDPALNVKQLAPGNPITFTASIDLIPAVTELANLDKIKVKPEPKKIEDKDVDQAIDELCKMRTQEIEVDREVQAKDKVVVDMDMKQAGVDLEGGQARDHGIYLDEDYYVPGLKDKLVGAKINESRTFTLKFPDEHYQKNLAGQDVDFEVTIKKVCELRKPPADDELAKSLGQESIGKLKELVRTNMEQEANDQAMSKAENEALEKIIEGSKFEDIPDAMINQEVDRMVHELEHEISHRGMNFDEYLKKAGKNLAQVKLDFAGQALKRAKSALIMRAIGEQEKITVEDGEMVEEQKKLLNQYSQDGEAQAKIRSEEFQDYIRANLRNRKVMDLIREKAIQK